MTTVAVFLVSEIVSLLFPQLDGAGVKGEATEFAGAFGFPWWVTAVGAGGGAVNATLNLEGRSLTTTQQARENLAIELYQSSVEFGAALAAWGVAVSLASDSLAPFAFAVLFLTLACIGAMMAVYVFTTSLTNYQAGHATGVAMAMLGAAMALFGGLGLLMILMRFAAELTPNLRLLIAVGGLFILFDVLAAAVIVST
jgi:hypothetical protein